MRKKFICLAKSVKYGGFCIAGKEVLPNGTIGGWLRPVHSVNSSIPIDDCNFDIGDFVSVEVIGRHHHPTQPENYVLDINSNWKKEKILDNLNLNLLVDTPTSIWNSGHSCSSKNGINDRINENIAIHNKNSLLFLFLPKAIVWKKDQSTETKKSIKIRLNFIYNRLKYSLVITDPKLTERFWDNLPLGGYETLYNIYVTISLGEPRNGYCYKLIAGHIHV